MARLRSDQVKRMRKCSYRSWRWQEVIRAKMILLAAQGIDNDEIAARLDTRREVVSQWRKRFFTDRLAGLDERVRPGRPRTHAAAAQS